jgi:hypothetical protein
LRTQNILTLTVSLPKYSYPDANRQAEAYTRLLEELPTLPGVKAIGAINDLPLTANRDSDEFTIEGCASKEEAASTGIAQDR